MSRNDIINSFLFQPLVRQFVKAGGGSGASAIDIVDDSEQIIITKAKVGGKDIYTIADQPTGGGGGGTTQRVAVYRGVSQLPTVSASEVEATTPENSSLKNVTYTFDTGNGGYWWIALPSGVVANFFFGVTNVQPYVQAGVTVNGSSYDIYVAPSETVDIISIRVDATSLPSTSPTAPDTTRPAISLASSEGSTTTLTSIPIVLSVTRSVTGLESSDISVTNGTIQNFSGTGLTYTFDVVPDIEGDVVIQVPENVCQDSFGNLNTASPTLTITYTSSPVLSPQITNVAVSPNPVEQFEILQITWSKQDVAGVNVRLFKNNVLVRSLASNLNANSYTWNVPLTEPTGSDYKIRVEAGAVIADSPTFQIIAVDDAYTTNEYDQLS